MTQNKILTLLILYVIFYPFHYDLILAFVIITISFIVANKGVNFKIRAFKEKLETVKSNYNLKGGKAKKLLNLKQFQKKVDKKQKKQYVQEYKKDKVSFNSLNNLELKKG